jgi:predicted outer membrane lipoprotein
MQHAQGFTGSHWMPPLGDYLLRIALAAARAIINTIMMQHVPTLLAVLMAIAMRRTILHASPGGFHKSH